MGPRINDVWKYEVDTVLMGGDWERGPRFEILADYRDVDYLDRAEGVSDHQNQAEPWRELITRSLSLQFHTTQEKAQNFPNREGPVSPHIRRILYVIAFEITAIILVIIALTLIGFSGGNSGLTAVATSTVAMAWNYAWNTLFEGWEQRQHPSKRTVKRRIAHAAGFEAGLIILLVPLMAWILKVSLLEAFILDIGLMIFFLIYTFVFAWLFDLVLPRTRPANSDKQAPTQ